MQCIQVHLELNIYSCFCCVRIDLRYLQNVVKVEIDMKHTSILIRFTVLITYLHDCTFLVTETFSRNVEGTDKCWIKKVHFLVLKLTFLDY